MRTIMGDHTLVRGREWFVGISATFCRRLIESFRCGTLSLISRIVRQLLERSAVLNCSLSQSSFIVVWLLIISASSTFSQALVGACLWWLQSRASPTSSTGVAEEPLKLIKARPSRQTRPSIRSESLPGGSASGKPKKRGC
jgi:hypothetical protein